MYNYFTSKRNYLQFFCLMLSYKFTECKQQGNSVHVRYNVRAGVSNALIPSALTFLDFEIP